MRRRFLQWLSTVTLAAATAAAAASAGSSTVVYPLSRHYVVTSAAESELNATTTGEAGLRNLRRRRKRDDFFAFWSAVCPNLVFTVCPYQPHPVRGIGITLTFMSCLKRAMEDGAPFSFFYEDDARLYADLASRPDQGGSEFCPGGFAEGPPPEQTEGHGGGGEPVPGSAPGSAPAPSSSTALAPSSPRSSSLSLPEKIMASWTRDTAVLLLGGHDFSHGCPYSTFKVRRVRSTR